jgi:hypothetical protein
MTLDVALQTQPFITTERGRSGTQSTYVVGSDRMRYLVCYESNPVIANGECNAMCQEEGQGLCARLAVFYGSAVF